MTLSNGQPSLLDIANDAAADALLVEYLKLRGVKTAATLALLATDDADLDRVLIQLFVSGWKRDDGSILQVGDSEKPIARAVFLHMWQVARQHWRKQMTVTAPVTSTTTTASPSGATPADDKIPKTLAPGRWISLLAAYQSQQIGGRDRIFPVQELLGTEAVLARVLHEHENSKLYTPIQLGELISLRTFLPTGEPNPLAKKDRATTKLQLTGGSLVETADEPWQPRSILAILDGLTSIRWAYTLCNVGSEQAIETFFQWLTRLARSRPQKTDQFSQFWLSTSWRLAMDMRAGRTFDEATPSLMRDFDAFSECMAREPSSTVKRVTTPTRPTSDSKGPGKGNSKGGKNSRYAPYQRNSSGYNKPWSQYADRLDRSSPRSMPSPEDKQQTWNRDAWQGDWKTEPKK